MDEFLITNINGSYANMSISGKCERMHAGYLVAALTPPRDRVTVLESVSEHIIDGTYSEASYPYNKDGIRIYTPNTLPDIKPVKYTEDGFIPSMHFSSSLIDFTRNVFLHNSSQDMVRLDYECFCHADHSITLLLEPLLSFRRPDTLVRENELQFSTDHVSHKISPIADKTCGPLQFTEIGAGETFSATFTPITSTYTNIPCLITLKIRSENSALSVVASGNTDNLSESHYTKDEQTGEPGVSLFGVCRKPYLFTITVPSHGSISVSILCEIHRTDNIDSVEAGRLIKNTDSFLKTPFSELKTEGIRRSQNVLSSAHADTVCGKFTDNHPETGRLYTDMVLSATKFITGRSDSPYSTVMAGYPWFLDWGRDTMIAFTGLLLVTGRYDTARDVLRSFAQYVRHGMIPNVFPYDSDGEPQYNTVDASLWFFYAVDMYVRFSGDEEFVRNELLNVLRQIISLYSRSKADLDSATTESFCFGIYMDSEGLVHAGTDKSDQLTWMDVRIDGCAVTPRHDCPIEIQALMYNALNVMMKYDSSDASLYGQYRFLADKMKDSAMLFYNPDKHCLFDYIEGEPGARINNSQLRPNQIWAVSLPYTMYDRSIAGQILMTVKKELVVNLGIRSLAPSDPAYKGRYEGNLTSRDRAYHNGTSWGFLIGHYILAYLKVFGSEPGTEEYLHNLLIPYLEHAENEGCRLGIAEVFDGDSPCEGKGCYNQAWSVGCLLEGIYGIYKTF